MGVCTDTMTITRLSSQKHDLEYQTQLITDTKMKLARSASELMQVGTDLDPESPALREIEHRRENLHRMEKKLDMQLEANKSRIQAISTEMQSVQQMLQQNIQSSFSYGIGGGR